ncbi:Daunorubicin/doxorubicin resistance ATP-binding protein DrrA [uncultured Eubacterium sp.]|nr:Daunorubicin/doxorubicin resistance ATP-binding protein DrrA [uncultured Eubacterium sp.]
MSHIIEIKQLEKSYGSVKAVKEISFYVEEGGLFAFLGPNGAGKSTTINMICTFLKPDSGSIQVDGFILGKDDASIRKRIGVVFQSGVLDDLLTVEENLLIRGSFYNLKGRALKEAVKRAAKATDLMGFLKRPYGKLSGGQRRRADIARALIHTPHILFLDEPTTGLDPQSRRSIWNTIKRLQAEQNMTVFLTTHYMEEAEDADYCIIVDDGKIAAKGTPLDLKSRYAKDKMSILLKESSETVKLKLESTIEALDFLKKYEGNIREFTVEKGSMDDVFIGVTGKEIRE